MTSRLRGAPSRWLCSGPLSLSVSRHVPRRLLLRPRHHRPVVQGDRHRQPDRSFTLTKTDTIASVQQAHRRRCETSRATTAELPFDATVHGDRAGPVWRSSCRCCASSLNTPGTSTSSASRSWPVGRGDSREGCEPTFPRPTVKTGTHVQADGAMTVRLSIVCGTTEIANEAASPDGSPRASAVREGVPLPGKADHFGRLAPSRSLVNGTVRRFSPSVAGRCVGRRGAAGRTRL